MTGWQIVESDTGYHARFVAANHKIILASEVYTRRRGAIHAIDLVAGANTFWSWVDERTTTDDHKAATSRAGLADESEERA